MEKLSVAALQILLVAKSRKRSRVSSLRSGFRLLTPVRLLRRLAPAKRNLELAKGFEPLTL